MFKVLRKVESIPLFLFHFPEFLSKNFVNFEEFVKILKKSVVDFIF